MPSSAVVPSSQHHSGLARQLSASTDLTEEQTKMCDDIIALVAQAGHTGEVPCLESRQGFWDAVFSSGWTTNSTNRHPGEIRERRAVESRILIGTWEVDLPIPSTPSKKRKSSILSNQTLPPNPPNPNPARRAGAPAYLKPNLNWSQYGMTYIVCDENGSAASDQYVRLQHGLTMAQAHSDVIKHFDKNESLRVTRYNNEPGVCWGRSRLLTSLQTSGIQDTQGTVVAQGNRPTSNAGEIPMNTAELVKLETCYGRILNIMGLIADSAAIASASKEEKYSDLRNR